jgi:O-ureido-D-serine cyclo-ligase
VRPRVALVSARAARAHDEDLEPLAAALAGEGIAAEVADWDEPRVDWAAFDLAVLRSTWDYAERITEFLAWIERISRLTVLLNPAAVVRWNTDKHYLRELAAAGVPVVTTRFIEPKASAAAALTAFLAQEPGAELVVKPAIGAGSRDAARYRRSELAAATAHAGRLLEAGRSVMLQPYLEQVEREGETALIYLGGRFSHAVRKGPLLRMGGEPVSGLFAPEQITPRSPSAAQLDVAQRALAALPFPADPVYARVDLLGSASGRPVLLELELTEPSLFFPGAPGAAARLAAHLRDQLPLASR